MRPLLLLRPQPGNDASAARARVMGLEVIQVPLFEIVAAEAEPVPETPFDAVLLTSANGARFGAATLAAHAGLPLYAVGAATAGAAREAGHAEVIVGGGNADSTAAMMAAQGHMHVLHLCGADARPFDPHGLSIVPHVVYRAAARAEAEVSPMLEQSGEAVAAIHSPRAGRRLRTLLSPAQRARIHLAAISEAAAQACGSGWASVAVSAASDDTALLHCAKALCICADRGAEGTESSDRHGR